MSSLRANGGLHRPRPSSQAWHVLFVPLAGSAKEISCRCAACGGSFPCELWRYPALLPASQAATLSAEELLARTNPGLADRVQWKQQACELGCDARFAAAYEQLEGLRPGPLHADLRKQLLDWEQLDDDDRDLLGKRIAACTRGWKVARQVAHGFPGDAGSLAALAAALLVWSAFLWAPFVRGWLAATVTVMAGCGAAALTGNLLLARRLRCWVRESLVPVAQRANVSLPCFLAVVEDLPGTRQHILDDTWPLKDQVERIRAVLATEGHLGRWGAESARA